MKSLHFAVVFVILLTLSATCYGDTNTYLGSQYSTYGESTSENQFQINCRDLLGSLATNGPVHDGFYKTEIAKKSEKLYGLIQCRGDISADDCSKCSNNITKVALDFCRESRHVWIWFRWCFLRYSNDSFFGSVQQTSGAWASDTDFDDPSMGTKGLDFMAGLATNASKQPLMFQTAVLDVGQSGKRYGMAQCTRDIIEPECRKCLNDQLVTFKETIRNKRGWEIHGSNCFMTYRDYQFFFNISTTPASEGARRLLSHKGATIGLISAILVLLMVL